MTTLYQPRPHPYLQQAVLYISNLSPHVTDQDLANAFAACVPFRPTIDRDGAGHPLSTGNIVFKHFESAEKALATLQSRPVPGILPPVFLSLSASVPTIPPTPIITPSAHPRLVKQLPDDVTDSELYDLFRPFGSLASVRTQAGFGPGTAVVEFFFEEEAQVAEETMHCSEIRGQTIAVQLYQPNRKQTGTYSEFSPNAPAFVPSASMIPALSAYPPVSPTTQMRGSAFPAPIIHGPGQQVQLAPLVGPGSNSHSGLIDPCNLFIKNLDPDIDSNALFAHFREFGHIVSARVMRNELGASRGFGFVSYQGPDQAAQALHTMDGVQLGSKNIIVRLHEPKSFRQDKLAKRFGGQGTHPRSGSGATSPTLSDGADSVTGWPSPGHAHPGLSTSSPPAERVRRSSGSYQMGTLGGSNMQYDNLAALPPPIRKDVLTGEVSRRVKDLSTVTVTDEEFDSIVDSIVGLSLQQVVDGIQDPSKLVEQVRVARSALSRNLQVHQTPETSSSSSPAPSQDSRLLDPQALLATASAPEHPSTPISFSGSLSDPPRTSSPSGSIPANNDKQRLLTEVTKLEPTLANDITNLLMSLSKRERALCLFSSEILRQKVADAKEIVALDAEAPSDMIQSAVTALPITPEKKKLHTTSLENSPQTPDLSSRATSAIASPMPATPGTSFSADVHTLASLARLPAIEIVKIATSASASTGVPLPKADPLVVRATDDFIDSIKGQSIPLQKQALGEKLFKFVKTSSGAKNAGKFTIQLLDAEDLRSLAHLMNSYPSVLKEKIAVISKPAAASK